jgi:hypothetical protein
MKHFAHFLVMTMFLGLAACSFPTATPAPMPLVMPKPLATAPAGAALQPPQPVISTPLPTDPASNFSASAATNLQNPSGPYAIILVESNDVLNIRSKAGAANASVGTFPPTFTGVMRTGPSVKVGNALWVEVTRPDGGTGWVNSRFLTDVAPATTCDPKIMSLLDNLGKAVLNSDGKMLTSLVSPLHGVDIWLWRSGNVINFDAEHFRWVLGSTYRHNWGKNPASGVITTGPFHDAVLPALVDVYQNAHEIRCNHSGVPGWNANAWLDQYRNITVYSIYKPGADWRTWLAGFEYVNGNPYLFALINFQQIQP